MHELDYVVFILPCRRETISKLRALLDFKNSITVIDNIIVPMQMLSVIEEPQYIQNSLEPEKKVTKCKVNNLDVMYEKLI